MAEEGIFTAMHGSTLVVTIDRPEVRNAITWAMIEALGEHFDRAGSDPTVRSAVLTGSGTAFCSGGDLRDQQLRTDWVLADFITKTAPLVTAVRSMWNFPKPLVAAVNGVAAGAGAALAVLCDVRIAERSSRFAFAFPKVGLAPDLGCTWMLPRLVGPDQACRLLFSGAFVDAARAAEIGLVTELVEDGEALTTALSVCAEFDACAPVAVQLAKASLRRSSAMTMSDAIEMELLNQNVARCTEDHREGLRAYRERRAPVFEGR